MTHDGRPRVARSSSAAPPSAIGLALLLFMPLPFMRGFGVGGLIIPAVSVLAALTFLPVRALARRAAGSTASGCCRSGWLERRADHERGFWAGLARGIMRRPWPVAVATTAFLLLLARRCWRSSSARARTRASRAASRRCRASTCSRRRSEPARRRRPTIVVDTGAPAASPSPAVQAARRRACAAGSRPTRRSRASTSSRDAAARRPDRPLPATSQVVGESDYGKPESLDFVDRLRDEIVPAAGFPAGVDRRTPAAARRAARTSSTSPTAGSRGSCSRCCSRRTSCSCGPSARCSCR